MSKPDKQYSTDVLIIGAGPVGLFAVFQCGMLKMKCHVVDSLAEIGGQCTALYPEKPIYDIPAAPELTGGELIARLEQQAAPFNPVYHLNQQVMTLAREGENFKAITSKNTEITCKAIIIAGGAGAFGPNRPPMEGIEAFENTSVFYMVKRREDFTGKKIAIAGGGDSAVDWAISLAPLAEKIYFIHRRDKFRAAPESVDKLQALAKDGKIEMVVPYQLHALHGANGKLDALDVADLDGTIRTLEIDTLLPFFGLTPNLGPVKDWGIDVDLHHIPVDFKTQQTNIPGIFAAGDICTYDNKLKLILNGFAEAAMAAHAIHPRVFPGQALHFVYSTTKGVP